MKTARNELNEDRVADSSLPLSPLHAETRGEGRIALVDQLAADMASRWEAGERPIAEEYLNRHPFLWSEPEQAIQLIYEEICLRAQHHDTTSWEGILDRFPKWHEQLQVLLDCHHIVSSLPGPPMFPEVGENLGEFQLISELGRGSQGRVFLAKQESLGDRLIVLKVTALSGEEHLSLARLQHTHIVPLYSTLIVPERNLRAICMPYFGGKTLAQLLTAMHNRASMNWNGSHLIQVLGNAAPRTSPRQFLTRASQVQVICWIGMCIADALKYAHDRGLLHLDIKPSNLLIAEDGQPMLLDFHLAQQPIAPDGKNLLRIGGTPGYMAPEHEAAVEAMRRQERIKATVDGRADVYSLGITLYEALAGDRSEKPARLDLVNAEVSTGFADIIDRCLASNPADRYADAEELSNDLRRHLNDLPLSGVANRSLTERWRKWRRRRPHLLAIYALTAIVIFVAIVGVALITSQLGHARHEAQLDLEESKGLSSVARYDEAVARAKAGLSRLDGLPTTRQVEAQLRTALVNAERLRSADDLHKLVNQLRALYDVSWISPAAAQRLQVRCKRLWDSRASLKASEPGQASILTSQLKADLLDVAILTAALELQLSPRGESENARKNAEQILDQAEIEYGRNPVLSYERQLNFRQVGASSSIPGLVPRDLPTAGSSSWEQWAFGRALLREGHYRQASQHFHEALKKDPQNPWPNFYEGICAYRTKRYLDAAIAFTVCIDNAPQMPECFYNRALTFSALQKEDRALADYGRALQLRPEFPAAAFNRGLLHYHANRRTAAAADFKAALAAGLDPSLLPEGISSPKVR